MNRSVLTSLVLLLFCARLQAVNFREIPQFPGNKMNNLFWLYTSNDGLGYDLGDDWDDMRTYGFLSGALLFEHLLLSLDFHCFTDRNAATEDSKRIDEIKMLSGWKAASLVKDNLYLHLFIGGGALLYGNFGTVALQESFHSLSPESRPITHVYEESDAMAFAFYYLEAGDLLGLNLNLRSYGHITNRADFNIDLTLGWWVTGSLSDYCMSFSCKFNGTDSLSQVAQNVYAAENGLWYTNTMMAWILFFERSIGLGSGIPMGTVGIRLGAAQSKGKSMPFRFDYLFAWNLGINSNVDMYRIHPFAALRNLDFFLRFQNIEDFRFETWEMIRCHTVSAGIDYYLWNPDTFNWKNPWEWLNPFVFAGAGFVRDRQITHDAFHAQVLDQRILPVLHTGGGVRLQIPDIIFGNEKTNYGAEFMCNVRFTLGDTLYFNPHVSLVLGAYISEG